MKNLFIETSVINFFIDKRIASDEIQRLFSQKGYSPVIGCHVIYELAQVFLRDEKSQKGQYLFALIKNINPDISEECQVLLRSEYQKCFSGAKINVFLRGQRKREAIEEIKRLSEGNLSEKAKNFIRARSIKFNNFHQENSKRNIDLCSDKPNFCSFNSFLEYYENPSNISNMIMQILEINTLQASGMANNIARFPALHTAVRAQMYLLFIAAGPKASPSQDKVDDHRHLIEASYCDAFMTEDKQLLHNIRKINPKLEPIRCSSWFV